MKFPSCGLIISLSLFLFSASFCYAKDNTTTNDPSAPTAVKESNASTAPAQNKAVNQDTEKKINSLQQTVIDLSYQIDSYKNNLSVSTTSILNQISEIKQKQNNILIMLKSLKDQFNTSKSTMSQDDEQITGIKKEQEDMMSMLIKLNEGQEILKDKVAVLSGNVDRTSAAISTSTQKTGLVPSKASLEQHAGQQYVKLKLMEDGQEVELYLDPSYVDMDIALPKNKKNDKTANTTPDSKKDNENIDKIMQYLSQFADAKTAPTTTQPQQQAVSSGQPQQNSNMASPPPSPNNTDNLNNANTAKSIENPAIEDSQTLDELLKAQKYFYEKKYNAALNAVQRSLAKQETALAYAIEGSIYFTMGDVDLAVSSWESALKINPNMTEVRKALFKYKR